MTTQTAQREQAATTIDLDPKPAQPLAVAAEPQQPTQRQMSVIEYAMKSGASAAEIKAMMELQVQMDNHQLALMQEKRRMDKEDRAEAAHLAFEDALVKFRGYNVVIPKTKEVVQTARGGGPGPRFMQSEYDVVVSLISGPLSECGLSFRHDQEFGTREWKADGSEPNIPAGTQLNVPWVYVTCILTHRDGHSVTLKLSGPPDTSGSKNPLQEMQSAASFLKRQSVLTITGTPTAEEDDENRFNGHGKGKGGAANTPAPEQEAHDAQLLAKGRDASMNGMDKLNAWWQGLTQAERDRLTPQFGPLRGAARTADQAGKGSVAA